MAQFESSKDEIAAAGVQVLYVAAQTRGGILDPEKFLREHPVSFPFLLDEDRKVTKAYGVYYRIGFEGFNIARPATFVIDRKGVVQFIHIGTNQFDRAPLDSVVKVLR
jgi:peroxiredoxin